jgi:hypothetical protein
MKFGTALRRIIARISSLRGRHLPDGRGAWLEKLRHLRLRCPQYERHPVSAPGVLEDIFSDADQVAGAIAGADAVHAHHERVWCGVAICRAPSALVVKAWIEYWHTCG